MAEKRFLDLGKFGVIPVDAITYIACEQEHQNTSTYSIVSPFAVTTSGDAIQIDRIRVDTNLSTFIISNALLEFRTVLKFLKEETYSYYMPV
jgi:hypothetical protein